MASGVDGESVQTVAVEGTRLKLSNLDKVLYPATGTTKAQVISYYHRIGSIMVPHLRGRPVTRKRWVHGVGTQDDPGTVFFQKNLDPNSTPDWVRRFSIEHHDRTNDYPVADDLATLVWLAQLASLEIHVPQWRFGTDGAPQHPDRLVLDLDPGPGTGLPECVQVARWAKQLLEGVGYQLVPVTSGSKGIHLYARLDGELTSEQASAVAKEVAETLQRQHPDLVTAQMGKQHRTGKVFIDWSQNNANKTTISPYSLRGRARPMVAAPRRWDELDENLEQLDLDQMLERVNRIGDLFAPVESGRESPDRLARYRSKRDPARTPEPVPAPTDPKPDAGAAAGTVPSPDKPSFVIQEHHARRLHYDFRLEREGVLVSWAVPKGAPTDTRTNHLAVQTEDHPLEYGAFEGIIPAAEYGGGEVIITDTGQYELEKWRDGKEVIVTLHGTKSGGVGSDCKIALIHTGGRGQPENHWLMHLMSGEPAEPEPATEEELQQLRDRAARELTGMDEHETGDSVVWHSDRGPSTDSGREGQGGAEPVDASSPSHNTTGLGPPRQGQGNASTNPSPEDAGAAPVEAPAGSGTTTGSDRGTGSDPVFPDEIRPMLAGSADPDDLSSSADWAYEMKWDGVRAVCYVSAGRVKILSRRGRDVTASYPEIAEALADLRVDDAIADGEIVATDEDGRPSFGRLQQRMNLGQPADIARIRKTVPVQLVLFDLLHRDGRSLLNQHYASRRHELERLTAGPDGELLTRTVGRIQIPPVFDGDLPSALQASRTLGLEGVVAKKHSSIYQAGSRGRTWLKIKNVHTQEVVIVGWRTGQGRRSATVGSLLMAVPQAGVPEDDQTFDTPQSDTPQASAAHANAAQANAPDVDIPQADASGADAGGPVLAYAGRVGTGFSDAELDRLHAAFAAVAVDRPQVQGVPAIDARDAHWIEPVWVGEVSYAEWTHDHRLRSPVWRGWRPDKTPSDVRIES